MLFHFWTLTLLPKLKPIQCRIFRNVVLLARITWTDKYGTLRNYVEYDSWWRSINVPWCCIRDKMKRITVIILQALLIMLYQISCSVPWLGRVVYVNKLFQLPRASVSLCSSQSPGTHILCGSYKRDLWRQYRQTAWTCNWWETVNQ